jgi:phosphate transport system protein
MADLTRSMVVLATGAVKDRSKDVCAEIADLEKRLDQMQTDIDQEAIRMLTVYGPVATDLRYLLVATHVTSQLERIGDQVVNIGQALNLMSSEPTGHPTLAKLHKMADLVCETVDNGLDAFFSRNEEKAITVRRYDDVIDALNDEVLKTLLTEGVLREVLSKCTDIADVVAQILIARCMERIADQAKNICKQLIYLVKGHDVRHVRPE